eukprot:534290-Pyramimonas_sp.AAC.1
MFLPALAAGRPCQGRAWAQCRAVGALAPAGPRASQGPPGAGPGANALGASGPGPAQWPTWPGRPRLAAQAQRVRQAAAACSPTAARRRARAIGQVGVGGG